MLFQMVTYTDYKSGVQESEVNIDLDHVLNGIKAPNVLIEREGNEALITEYIEDYQVMTQLSPITTH